MKNARLAIFFAASFVFALGAEVFAQKPAADVRYSVNVSTYVGGKLEDKFTSYVSEGESIKKGFESRILIKRYLTEGFDNAPLEAKRKEAKEQSEEKPDSKSPLDMAKEMHRNLVREIDFKQSDLDAGHLKLESLIERKQSLENIVKANKNNADKLSEAMLQYKAKYVVAEVDPSIEKIRRRAPKNRGDFDAVDLGSYCELSILKAFPQGVSIEGIFSYSRIMSWMYADNGKVPSNGKIVKFPMVESFERETKANIAFGKAYCIQFGRTSNGTSSSLKAALSKSSLFDMGSASTDVPSYLVSFDSSSALNASGNLEDIEKQFASDTARTVRIVIKITPVK